MLEIKFLEDCGIDLDTSRVLDIGAGYGRLADRLMTAFPGIFVACADPITMSRFVCRRYLTSRGFPSTVPVLHPDQVSALRRIDLAINVHSWSECTPEEVEWWMHTLRIMKVPRLFVVPHGKDSHDPGRGTHWGAAGQAPGIAQRDRAQRVQAAGG